MAMKYTEDELNKCSKKVLNQPFSCHAGTNGTA